jgi:hypothetical protein
MWHVSGTADVCKTTRACLCCRSPANASPNRSHALGQCGWRLGDSSPPLAAAARNSSRHCCASCRSNNSNFNRAVDVSSTTPCCTCRVVHAVASCITRPRIACGCIASPRSRCQSKGAVVFKCLCSDFGGRISHRPCCTPACTAALSRFAQAALCRAAPAMPHCAGPAPGGMLLERNSSDLITA